MSLESLNISVAEIGSPIRIKPTQTTSIRHIQAHSKPIKSPLNYIGGKYKLLPQILPLLPQNIDCFVDLFAGGCNVGVNAKAKKTVCNDNLTYLVELYKSLQNNSVEETVSHIENRIAQFNLSLENETGYKELRTLYNSDREHLDLFVLVAYSFNHQIRFNNNHHYNNPFGRQRSSFNGSMRQNLIAFIEQIHSMDIDFLSKDFEQAGLDALCEQDFVYCDPPYLITTGTYNDGKRGFNGWNRDDEERLLALLCGIDARGVKFALSNVLEHKGKSNDILKEWIAKNGYYINYLNKDYSNSSYNTIDRDRKSSIEVLITNYHQQRCIQSTLF